MKYTLAVLAFSATVLAQDPKGTTEKTVLTLDQQADIKETCKGVIDTFGGKKKTTMWDLVDAGLGAYDCGNLLYENCGNLEQYSSVLGFDITSLPDKILEQGFPQRAKGCDEVEEPSFMDKVKAHMTEILGAAGGIIGFVVLACVAHCWQKAAIKAFDKDCKNINAALDKDCKNIDAALDSSPTEEANHRTQSRKNTWNRLATTLDAASAKVGDAVGATEMIGGAVAAVTAVAEENGPQNV